MPKQTDTSIDTNVQNAPSHHLIVVHPFAQYAKGVKITDGDEIADILVGENARFCNKVLPS
jgi:hypothetical protein